MMRTSRNAAAVGAVAVAATVVARMRQMQMPVRKMHPKMAKALTPPRLSKMPQAAMTP